MSTATPRAVEFFEEPNFRLGAGLDFTDPNSPLAPYYVRASHVVAAVILAGLFLIITHLQVWHTDIWGHLGFGREMVTTLRLPADDPLCPYAERGVSTIHYAWLSQATFYVIYHVGELLAGGDGLTLTSGGAEALRLTHAIALTLRCLLLLLAFRRLTGSMSVAVFGLVALLAASIGNLAVVRPQIFGELFFAALLFALSRKELSRRAMILIPILMAVWANFHASFAVGFMLLGCIALGRAIELAFDDKTSIGGMFANVGIQRSLIATLLSLGLVAVANPAGPMIFRNLFEMSAHPVVRAMDEWQPLKFTAGPGGQWAFAATLAFCLLGFILGRRMPTPAGIFVIAVFASQPLVHQRTFIWWLMVAPWVALPACAAAFERLPRWETIPSFRKTLMAAAVVLLAIAWSGPTRWALNGAPAAPSRAMSDGTPWQIAATLRQAPNLGDLELQPLGEALRRSYPGGRFTGRVFATETLGDYFLWDLPREHPVFIYSHVHLFSPTHWEQVLTVRHGDPGWQKVLSDNQINLVVVEADFNPALCQALHKDAGWKVVLDETGLQSKRDRRSRLFAAVRLKPIN